jgi:hypothetical protein
VRRLFWYQRLDVVYHVARRGCGLNALEAGMGKSQVTMALLEYYSHDPEPANRTFPVLILAPSAMIADWEHKLTSHLPVAAYPELADTHATAIVKVTTNTVLRPDTHRVVICTYDAAKTTKRQAALLAFGFRTCVADESHKALRSPSRASMPAGGSLATERLVPLIVACRHRLLLSATPAEKTGAHYQPQLHCLRPDVAAFRHYATFGNRYGRPMLRMTGSHRDTVVYAGHTNAEELHQLLVQHVMFRLTNATRLRTEDQQAAHEFAEARAGRTVHYRYTSRGLKAQSLPSCMVGAPAGDTMTFAGGTRAAARLAAHNERPPLPRDRVTRRRQVQWIDAAHDHEATTVLARMAEEEKAMQTALDETRRQWALAREDPAYQVDIVHGSVDSAALEVEQKRNELLRRSSTIKVRLARAHLLTLLGERLGAGEKVVVMAYHKNMLNTCEGVVRDVLAVGDDRPRLTPPVAGSAGRVRGAKDAQAVRGARGVPAQSGKSKVSLPTAPVSVPGSAGGDGERPAKRVRRSLAPEVPPQATSLGAWPGGVVRKDVSSTQSRVISARSLLGRAKLPYIRLDGSVSSTRLIDASINRFQTDPTCRVALLSIPKACLGITLTAGTTLVFAELTHKPQDLLQAEARIDRRGQTAAAVDIIYLLLKNSVEAQVWSRNRAKLDGASRMSDGHTAKFGYTSQTVEQN